jgi:hypothetical protein
MTNSEILDNLDGVLSDVSHLLDRVPEETESLMLLGIRRTLVRIATAIESRKSARLSNT